MNGELSPEEMGIQTEVFEPRRAAATFFADLEKKKATYLKEFQEGRNPAAININLTNDAYMPVLSQGISKDDQRFLNYQAEIRNGLITPANFNKAKQEIESAPDNLTLSFGVPKKPNEPLFITYRVGNEHKPNNDRYQSNLEESIDIVHTNPRGLAQ